MLRMKHKYEIIPDSNTTTGYSTKTILWSFTTPPVKGKIASENLPTTCRDSLTNALKFGHKASRKRYANIMKLGIRYFRLIAWLKGGPGTTQAYWDERVQVLKNGIHIVNLVEKEFGWPLTKLHTVKNSYQDTKTFMVTGSGKWHKAPVMVYLYVILLRMGKCQMIANCKTFDELYECWTNKLDQGFPGGTNGFGHTGDAKYIRTAAYYIPVLMRNFDQIFRGLDRKDTWTGKNVGYSAGLVSFNSALPSIHRMKGDIDKVEKNGTYVHLTVLERLYQLLVAQGYYNKKPETETK